ncbi:MAG: hypothetical protein WCS77_05205 [Elusimicrobiaceae bacterium]
MRKIFAFLLVFAAALFLAASVSAAAEKTRVTLFYSNHCKVCLQLKQEFLPGIKEKYADKTVWEERETDTDEANLALLYAVFAEHGLTDPRVPAVLVNDSVLLFGGTEIRERLEGEITKALQTGSITAGLPETEDNAIKKVFSRMSVSAVILSGLVDGINPCAFAVIVFFVSFLAVYGYNKRDIIYVGSAYCFAVFATYLLLGLGLFKTIYALSGFMLAMKIFYYLTAGFCFVLFGLSVYDFINYRKTGRSEEMLLKLPKSLKLKINRIMGAFLRGKERSPVKLIIASLTVGVAVSLIEAVCTGQVYVPTIVMIMKDSALRAQAFSYLVLYNIMFVVPLVGVFLLSLAGYESQTFNSFLKKHLGITKILLALVFLGLGLMLLANV